MRAAEQQKYIQMSTKAKPWERQPRESGQAFDAFLTFRMLGGMRKLSEVAKIVGKNHQLIRRWANQWDWHVRVAAWDEMLAERLEKAASDEAARMGKRQAQLGMKLQAVGERRVDMIATDDKLMESLTPNDAIRLVKEGVEIERKARGEEAQTGSGSVTINFNMATPKWAPTSKTVEGVGKLVKEIVAEAANDGN